MSDKLVGKISQPTYTQFVYKNFEWALLKNELKWKNMEPQKVYIDYCQIIILSKYVPSTHAYAHVLRLSLDLPYEKR